jgi:hypothetical protein
MIETLKTYWLLILNDRAWSWSLVGVAYLAITMLIRILFFRSLTNELKQVDRSVYAEVMKTYLKNSLGGWVLFLLSFLLFVAVWVGWVGPFTERLPLFLLGFLLPILFLLSIILHYRAFSKALVAAIRQRLGIEREF